MTRNKALWLISLTLLAGLTTGVFHLVYKDDIPFYEGKRFFDKGEFKQAIPYFHRSLQFNSKNLKVMVHLAHAYQWSHQFQKAIKSFENALALDKKNTQLKKGLAETLSWEKEYDRSLTLYQEILKETNEKEVKRLMAEMYLWQKKYSESIALLNEYLEENPLDEKAQFLKAQAYVYSGESQKAAPILKRLLKEK